MILGVLFQINKGNGYIHFYRGSFWDDDKHEDVQYSLLKMDEKWEFSSAIASFFTGVYNWCTTINLMWIERNPRLPISSVGPLKYCFTGLNSLWKKSHIPSLGPLLKSKLAFLGLKGYLQTIPTIFLLKRIGSNLVGLQEKFYSEMLICRTISGFCSVCNSLLHGFV